MSKIEQIGKNREKLLALEKEGKYVFHGSPDMINVLSPRQGHDFNEESGKMEKDGNPAVFATPYADIAIFRALTNVEEGGEKSTSVFGIDDKRLYFSWTRNLLEQAKEKTGKVYVLDKQKFANFKGGQCRSEEDVVPIEVVEVFFEDLPQNIQVIENLDSKN